jgi:hypothetical protein
MNTPPELSNVPVGGKGQWLRRRPLVIAVVIVGVAVFAIALVAGILLANAWPNSDWIPVYQDVLKTSFGALAVGGLGGLAKLIFDQRKALDAAADELRKEREAAASELRDRRYRFISTLVEVRHDVDTATTVIRANRSVESWTDMVNDRIIHASCRLRDMTHELNNWAEADLRVFDDTKSVTEQLRAMSTYLWAFLDDYAKNKWALQREAEEVKQKSQQEREEHLSRIWHEMQELPALGDLIISEDACGYSAYRDNYEGALLMMRRSLVPKGAARTTVTVSSAQGITTPLSSSPR